METKYCTKTGVFRTNFLMHQVTVNFNAPLQYLHKPASKTHPEGNQRLSEVLLYICQFFIKIIRKNQKTV